MEPAIRSYGDHETIANCMKKPIFNAAKVTTDVQNLITVIDGFCVLPVTVGTDPE
jgi:hypothetical protein